MTISQDTNPAFPAPPAPGSVRPEPKESEAVAAAEPSERGKASAKGEARATGEVPKTPERAMPDEDALAPRGSVHPTVRGGGRNRTSGGRTAAAAYVGVRTLAPGHGGADQHTAAISLDSRVKQENRNHATERALRPIAPTYTEAEAPQEVADEPRTSSARPVVLLVAGLALAVGVLGAVVAMGDRAKGGDEAPWDHGIDGQPGRLDAPTDAKTTAGPKKKSEPKVDSSLNSTSERPNPSSTMNESPNIEAPSRTPAKAAPAAKAPRPAEPAAEPATKLPVAATPVETAPTNPPPATVQPKTTPSADSDTETWLQ